MDDRPPDPTRPSHLRDVPGADRDDPPIILVPGIDGTALLFYRQVPLLAERFDVVAFPLPSTEGRRTSMDTLVDDLALLIEEVTGGGAILCGESFGGALSMATALDRPELVRGLVIVNSFPRIDQRLKLWAAPKLLRMLPWGAMPLVRRYTSAHLHSPHVLPEDLHEFHERAKHIDREGYIRRLEILRDFDITDRLGEIRAPTLLLAGDRDRLVPSVENGRAMQRSIPGAELRVLRGYGHVCLIDHDLDLLEEVEPWWDRVRRG